MHTRSSGSSVTTCMSRKTPRNGTFEADEEVRLSPRLMQFKDQPRTCLIELYGKPKEIKSKDQPEIRDDLSSGAKARLIQDGLLYERSEKIDHAVRDLMAA